PSWHLHPGIMRPDLRYRLRQLSGPEGFAQQRHARSRRTKDACSVGDQQDPQVRSLFPCLPNNSNPFDTGYAVSRDHPRTAGCAPSARETPGSTWRGPIASDGGSAAFGNQSSTVVPSPDLLMIRTAPPDCTAKP